MNATSAARSVDDSVGGHVDRAGFEEVYSAHSAELLRYVSRRIGPADAEDLVADTFVAAMRGWHTYDPAKGPPRAWLYAITTNLLSRHHQRETQRLLIRARQLDIRSTDGPENEVVSRVDAERRLAGLTRAIAGLLPGDRDVLLLSAWADLNAAEIALALGIPAGTVRSRLHRVRRQLATAEPTSPTSVRQRATYTSESDRDD